MLQTLFQNPHTYISGGPSISQQFFSRVTQVLGVDNVSEDFSGRNMLYVASTSGFVSGVSLELMMDCCPSKHLDLSRCDHSNLGKRSVMTFCIKWRIELDAPIFGSLCLDPFSGNVDGNVIALNPTGHIVWKVSIGGPIFAGACISSCLPSQLLICSRTGGLYSIDMEYYKLLDQAIAPGKTTLLVWRLKHQSRYKVPTLMGEDFNNIII
ncbi:hypothetical protein HPP92_005383 [Vanilla planifolia]|uniref:Uncharacterized protein n=1 Tax=Vanilla planifolia TaxID=51239 RepID=A0A835RPH7_VANPL|nr:hypothetical protein HPP92_005383 [Vanilla planifolia]